MVPGSKKGAVWGPTRVHQDSQIVLNLHGDLQLQYCTPDKSMTAPAMAWRKPTVHERGFTSTHLQPGDDRPGASWAQFVTRPGVYCAHLYLGTVCSTIHLYLPCCCALSCSVRLYLGTHLTLHLYLCVHVRTICMPSICPW